MADSYRYSCKDQPHQEFQTFCHLLLHMPVHESGEYQKHGHGGEGGRGRETEKKRERERERERDSYHDHCMIVLSQLSESDVLAKANISNKATFICLCQCSELVDAILYHYDHKFLCHKYYVEFWSCTFTSGWSGATPNLTSPNGKGRRSRMSTFESGCRWRNRDSNIVIPMYVYSCICM